MLNKAAEFYEDEVDNSVSQLSALMEPIIMVVLGSIIGTSQFVTVLLFIVAIKKIKCYHKYIKK